MKQKKFCKTKSNKTKLLTIKTKQNKTFAKQKKTKIKKNLKPKHFFLQNIIFTKLFFSAKQNYTKHLETQQMFHKTKHNFCKAKPLKTKQN